MVALRYNFSTNIKQILGRAIAKRCRMLLRWAMMRNYDSLFVHACHPRRVRWLKGILASTAMRVLGVELGPCATALTVAGYLCVHCCLFDGLSLSSRFVRTHKPPKTFQPIEFYWFSGLYSRLLPESRHGASFPEANASMLFRMLGRLSGPTQAMLPSRSVFSSWWVIATHQPQGQ
jgi:hypothetical protein